MNQENHVEITTYDILMRAWENSMEMTRDFTTYSKNIEDDEEVVNVFKEFAEEEGMHASKLRSMLLEYQNKDGGESGSVEYQEQ